MFEEYLNEPLDKFLDKSISHPSWMDLFRVTADLLIRIVDNIGDFAILIIFCRFLASSVVDSQRNYIYDFRENPDFYYDINEFQYSQTVIS